MGYDDNDDGDKFTDLCFFCLNCSFMFELLSKLNITYSTKDQVLEVMDKCNTLLVGGKVAVHDSILIFYSIKF